MPDTETSHVASIPISEHSRLPLATHKARITARLRLLAHQRTATLRHNTQQHLADDAAAFNEILVGHLDREEQVVVPSFESMISDADQRVLEKEESKLATYRHVRMAVLWVLANATPEEATQLRASVPESRLGRCRF